MTNSWTFMQADKLSGLGPLFVNISKHMITHVLVYETSYPRSWTMYSYHEHSWVSSKGGISVVHEFHDQAASWTFMSFKSTVRATEVFMKAVCLTP